MKDHLAFHSRARREAKLKTFPVAFADAQDAKSKGDCIGKMGSSEQKRNRYWSTRSVKVKRGKEE
jgi:hypothetical protein